MVRTSEKRMKRQRGQALILVLIVLSLGSLLITPTLKYVYTGFSEANISEKLLLQEYAADAAVEYNLWQLKYNVDDLVGQLSPENPSSNTTIIVNGIEVPIITEISMSPQSDNGSFTVPTTESGIHIATGLQILPPVWAGAGQKCYVTHLVYICNYGTSAVHLKSLCQQLDPSLTYVEGSYEGPDADFTKTNAGDHWELLFDFTEPLPKLNAQEVMVVSLVGWAQKKMGEDTFTGSGWVSYAAFQEEEVECYDGQSGLASFGLYDITVNVGGHTILVNMGITEEGEVVVRSWQLQ